MENDEMVYRMQWAFPSTKGGLTYYIRRVLPDLRFLICVRPEMCRVVIVLDEEPSDGCRELLDGVMRYYLPITLECVVEVLP